MKKSLAFLLLLLFLMPSLRAQDARPLAGRRIVVDPGHGALSFEREVINGGKYTRDGTQEHYLTVDISAAVAKKLEALGADVYLTRTKEDYWRFAYNSVDDNKSRAIFANALDADALISIHCDWHPRTEISGVTTLYAMRDSAQLARAIQRQMVKILRASDRNAVRNDFTILDHAQMPALIVETGFMSNAREAARLADPAYQANVGEAVANGLVEFFSL